MTPEVTVGAAGSGRRSSLGAGGSARAAVEPPVSGRLARARGGAAREGSGAALCGGSGARGRADRRAGRGHDSGRGRLGAPRRSRPKGRGCPGQGARCPWDPIPGHAGGVRRGSLARSSRRAAPPRPDCGPCGSAGRALDAVARGHAWPRRAGSPGASRCRTPAFCVCLADTSRRDDGVGALWPGCPLITAHRLQGSEWVSGRRHWGKSAELKDTRGASVRVGSAPPLTP